MIWARVLPEVNLALKITNWCNLHCAHCCERSSTAESLNLMPITKVEKYITEFGDMGVPVWKELVLTGGEALAPYLKKQEKYIPTIANIAAQNNLSVAIKTNAKWGENSLLRNRILNDLADVAQKNDRQISMDISIDEYHDNLMGAAEIVDTIMDSKLLTDAIPVSWCGLNTVASEYQRQTFVNMLTQRGITVLPMDPDGGIVLLKHDNMNVMFHDIGGLSRIGRAADNNLTDYVPRGMPNQTGNCFEITNTDMAILNYCFKTPVGNKTLGQLYHELKQQVPTR